MKKTSSAIRAKIASLGGRAASANMTPEQRSIRATAAGNATVQRYGIGYYSAMGKRYGFQKKQQ